MGCLFRGIKGTFSKNHPYFLSCFIQLGEKSQKLLKNHDLKNSGFKSGFETFPKTAYNKTGQKYDFSSSALKTSG